MVSIRGVKSNWGAGLAFGGLIVALLLNGVTLAATQHDSRHSSTPAQKAAQDPPKPAPPASTQAPEPYVYPYSCERPKSAEQDNLCIERKAVDAAEKQAVWAQNTFWLGVAGTIFVILTLAATSLSTWASKRSADAAVRQAELAQKALPRSWLYIELTPQDRPQVDYGPGGSLKIPMWIRNYGTIPGTIVSIETGLYVTGYDAHMPEYPFRIVTTPFEIGGSCIPDCIVECPTLLDYKYKGTTIAAGSGVPDEHITFGIPAPQRTPREWRGKQKFLRMIIRYSDPYGSHRETGYLGQLGRSNDLFIIQISDEQYSYYR